MRFGDERGEGKLWGVGERKGLGDRERKEKMVSRQCLG